MRIEKMGPIKIPGFCFTQACETGLPGGQEGMAVMLRKAVSLCA